MTRRGTLAYYLSAWVIGCFFVAALFSTTAESRVSAATVLITYFFALIGGLIGLLLFAWLLRHAMRLFATHDLWLWAAAGAVLFSAVVFVFALVADKRPASWWTGFGLQASNLLSSPARTAISPHRPVAGAHARWRCHGCPFLCLVDRAFRPEAGTSPAK